MSKILAAVANSEDCTTVFCDLFDTLIHRKAHPHYVLKLWAKHIIRELGLDIKIDELFFIRKASVEYVCEKLQKRASETPYDVQMKEVFNRLLNHEVLGNWSFETFLEYSEKADIAAETSVQFLNRTASSQLMELKEKGYALYCITDFYLSKEQVLELLKFHGLMNLFDDVFVSSVIELSKENKGKLYNYVLDFLGLDAKYVMMFGDNKISDVTNASKCGIKALHIPNHIYKIKNKLNLLGNDKKNYRRINRNLEKRSVKSGHAYGEYIILFHIFTERLYREAKRKQIKNLFFISREGYFMKKMFDHYQSAVQLSEKFTVNTHYFKASRHSATQVSRKELSIENFDYLRGQDPTISVENFFKAFSFSEELISAIAKEVGADQKEMVGDFFESNLFKRIKENDRFKTHYEKNRIDQIRAFRNYVHSFGIDFEEEGITLVDVGWRGTMQESIHAFFENNVKVSGYYLGLKEGNITKDTKRYGLNFSVYPMARPSDNILMANRQLYEQLLSAPHGSTSGYRDEPGNYPIEHYEEKEQEIYNELIAPVQNYMFTEYGRLIDELNPICYEYEVVQEYMTDLALRLGLFAGKRKIKFMHEISKGFYQNVGNNEVGLNYSRSQLRDSKLSLVKRFLLFPEKTFRFLVKIKPVLYAKGLYWLSYPVNLIYYYIKFVRGVRSLFLKKKLLEY